MNEIEIVVRKFKSSSKPEDRYTSFDYCYNYFLTTEKLGKDIEKSCLTLGFYLASWGMYRGSSFLLQKSVKYLEPTVDYIADLDRNVWNIDVDKYDEKIIEYIIEVYNEIKTRLIFNGHSDLTLITKILLGVFGFVPAFDNFFCDSFRNIYKGQCGFRRLNKKSLMFIKDFYDKNKIIINRLSNETFTTDFYSGERTNIKYTKAKIIDMYGFTLGLDKQIISKNVHKIKTQ